MLFLYNAQCSNISLEAYCYLYNDQFLFVGMLVYQFVDSEAVEEPCSILRMCFPVQVPIREYQ